MQECPFCYLNAKHKIIKENNTFFAIQDKSPVSRDHLLLIPKRHCINYFELTKAERCDLDKLLTTLRASLLAQDNTITGFNVGVNCGVSAGQTIFHAHVHLIPRRDNDTPHPRGGVRGVIPDKMDY